MPKKKTPSSVAMMVKVIAAFLDSGFWNAGTPFEIASVPLIATAPAEKARRINHRVSVSVCGRMGGGAAGWSVPVEA